MAFFDAEKMPDPQKEYVCFIDIMGIQSKMAHSIKQSSNYMFKLHATLLEAWRVKGYNSIAIYPIMDGAYITSRLKNDILNLLTSVYNNLVDALIQENKFFYWYMVRASIAYGYTTHGRNIPYGACLEFSSRVGYKEQLLISPAMIEAYKGERLSSPMGLHICDSASANYQGINAEWKWYANPNIKTDQAQVELFIRKFSEYYDWLNINSVEEEYPIVKRQEHFAAACKYYNIATD